MAPPPDDAQLMAWVAKGDQSALADLYDRHAPLMLAVARRMLKRGPEAEDLVHDVFVEAWRRAADYDAGRGTIRAWLLLRTRSRALDRLKSAAHTRSVHTEPQLLDELAGAASNGPSADRGALREALGGLPEEQRVVLMLGYFEGLSSSEIAERIGTPVGTVKSRVASALGKLRRALQVEAVT